MPVPLSPKKSAVSPPSPTLAEQWQHAPLRHVVVHHREDRLLDLPGVAGAADQDQPLRIREQHERRVGRTVDLGIGRQTGGVEDGELRFIALELLVARPQEEVAGEQVVPGVLVDHPDVQAVGGIRAGVSVEDPQLAIGEMGGHLPLHPVEHVGVDGPVDRSPPDLVVDLGLVDRGLRRWRTTGVGAGGRPERAGADQDPLLAAHGVFHQSRRAQVAMDVALRRQAGGREIDGSGGHGTLLAIEMGSDGVRRDACSTSDVKGGSGIRPPILATRGASTHRRSDSSVVP